MDNTGEKDSPFYKPGVLGLGSAVSNSLDVENEGDMGSKKDS